MASHADTHTHMNAFKTFNVIGPMQSLENEYHLQDALNRDPHPRACFASRMDSSARPFSDLISMALRQRAVLISSTYSDQAHRRADAVVFCACPYKHPP